MINMNKLLKWNAEFAKNVWLEITMQRLVAMPAIIFLIVMLIFVNSDNPYATLKYASVAGFVFLGILWGIKSASNSILDEYNEKTWDWQKMSIIGSWKLVIGKLFGSTIYNWYGALICLFLYLFTCLQDGTLGQGLPNALLLILSMVSLHGIIILMALQLIRKADGRAKIKSNRIFIVAFLLFSTMSNFLSFGIFGKMSMTNFIKWYGIAFDPILVSLITSIFYCTWIIAGLYRSMRAELQYSDKPTWWILFIISNFLFLFGFFIGNYGLSIKAVLMMSFALYFVQLIFLTYFLALTEPKDIVNFRTLQNSWVQKKWNTFLQNCPLWLITLPISFFFGFVLMILFTVFGKQEIASDFKSSMDFDATGMSVAFLIAMFGFIIRDLGVLLILSFSPKAKRANTAMFFYFLVIYMILPWLIGGGNDNFTAAFFPSPKSSMILMVAFPIAEAAVVLWFLLKRWKEIKREVMVA